MIINDGHEALSLRSLAGHLNVTAAALYAYVDDKLDLLRGVASNEFERLIRSYEGVAEVEPIERLYKISYVYIDAVNKARNKADMVLTLGSRLGETDWWGKAPYWARPDKQKMIQVDLDVDILGANRPLELAIQADVLGAFALGIRNILCLSGDHQRFGNHPTSKNVFDMDSIQLVNML